jgi:SdrD B-like domain
MTWTSCSRSSLCRPRRATILLLLLAYLASAGATSVRAGDPDAGGIRVVGLRSKEVEPGSFASLIVDVENLTLEARTVTLDLLPPAGWVVVSAARTARLDPLEQRSIPFTVRVPERATDDEGHEFTLVLSSPDGTPSLRLPQEVRVAPRPAVVLEVIRSEPHAPPGERAVHALRIVNAGNVSDLYTLAAESTPDWNVSVEPSRAFLRPGESADVLVRVDVPSRAVPGTLNHLDVVATGSELGAFGVSVARAPLSGVVTEAVRAPDRFRRLPLDVTTSLGRNRADEATYAMRLLSDGALDDDHRLLLESDFRADGPPESRRLEAQRMRARLTGPTWEASLGDVWSEMADVVSPTVGGRGAAFVEESGRWTTQGFLHVAKAGGSLPGPAWGGQVSRELTHGLSMDGGILSRRAETVAAPETELPRETFLTFATRWSAVPRLEVRSEAAWSTSVVHDSATVGRAGEVEADYRGDAFQATARGTSGQPKFAGRIRNERALYTNVRWSRSPDTVLWTNVDVVRRGGREPDDPVDLTRNVRLAGHFGDPGSELTLDSRSVGTSSAGATDRTRTDLFTVWSWRDMGPVRLGLSGKTGWKQDERADSQGLLWGGGAEVVGRVGNVRTSVVVDRSSEYRWQDGSEDFTSVSGDVSWVPARRPLSLGLGFRRHASASSDGAADSGHALRPRAEWRWGSAARFQLDAALDGGASDFGLKEWRFQLVWSGKDALPLLWNPRDAQPRGRVFLDVDLDGRFGPQDTPLAGVRVTVDGQPRVSGDHGEFEFPPAIGGSYRIELQDASVPPDLVAAGSFPYELPVSQASEGFFEIPLVRGGDVLGRVFRDEDRNGRPDPGEGGLPDIRMEILRDGVRVATNLTDPQGRYSFGKLPPGDYTLQVASDWMPAGWEATGRPVRVRVVPGGPVRADPVGLAPHRKPIRKTFDGTSGAR